METETYLDTVNLQLRTGGIINDPVTFTLPVTFTSIHELIIKYPTTYYASHCKDYTIFPSCVTISGGVATVEIPRARLLKPDYFLDYKNDNERPAYNTDTNFLDTLDIYRNYLDKTTGNNLVWWRNQAQVHCYANVIVSACEPSGACADVRQLACPYVQEDRLGFVQFEPATSSGGVYSKATYAVRRKPDGIETNFMRGYYDRYEEMDEDLQRAIIAWAHNNMPDKYCARCEVGTKFWQDDRLPIEPAVRIGSGKSTWGNLYAEQIIREFDAKQGSYHGGML